MRFAVYTLASVMIVVLVTGLALVSSQPDVVAQQSVMVREVFVDLDHLVQLHPRYEALAITRQAIADVRGSSHFPAVTLPKSSVVGMNSSDARGIDVESRQVLVKENLALAENALRKLEEEQREAIGARLRMRRETIQKSAESETTVSVRQIQDQAATQVAQVARKYCADRIDAELKVAALKAKVNCPGVDEGKAKSDLDAAEKRLTQINSQCAAETSRVWANANSDISNVIDAVTSRNDAALSIYESSEKRKISDLAWASHSEILDEMDWSYDRSQFVGIEVPVVNADNVGSGRLRSRTMSADCSRLSAWQAKDDTLELGIRQDVKRAVEQIARRLGVKVVFRADKDNIPDQTKRFADLMLTYGWRACGPVMSISSGS